MEVADHLDALAEQGRLLADAADRAGPDAHVPTCPEWTTRDLVRHTGAVHRWAAYHVRDAVPQLLRRDLEELVGGWPPDVELVAWFRHGHAELLDVLRAAPPDLHCATFLAAASPLAMWARRQAHETTIHRVDAELAAGAPLPHVPADLAADGIDELLTCFVTRPGRGPRREPPYRMVVQPTDAGAGWTLTVSGDDVEVARTDGDGAATTPGAAAPADRADVVVAGTAARLYPLLWNRSDATEVTVTGDPALMDHWREQVQVRMR